MADPHSFRLTNDLAEVPAVRDLFVRECVSAGVEEEEMQTLFLLEGVVQYLDDDDNVVSQDDVFTKLDRYLAYCRANGIEPQNLCY